MIKTWWFRGAGWEIKETMEEIDKWLEKMKDIEIVGIGQSQSQNDTFTITIFYKER